MALRLTLHQECGVASQRFGELSALVARASGRPVAVNKPITGSGVFCHESGIHVRGLLADPRTYEPFPAAAVGHRATEFVLGKHSGIAAVRHVLADAGVHVSHAQAAGLMADIRATACRRKTAAAQRWA